MKKMPLVFLIPIIAILVAVGIATLIKLNSLALPPTQNTSNEYPDPYASEPDKPTTFLGGLTSESTDDLNQELKSTFDDGGLSELDALEEEISGL